MSNTLKHSQKALPFNQETIKCLTTLGEQNERIQIVFNIYDKRYLGCQ